MRNITAIFIAGILLLSVLLLSGCGKTESPLVNTKWSLSGVTTGDGSFADKDLSRFGAAAVRLLKDGKAELDLGGQTAEGTYTLSAENGMLLAINVGGEERIASAEGDILTLVLSDTVTLHFTKDPEPIESSSK